MPSELLHLPPSYTLVGAYRLLTDPSIRKPVLDKIKHASIRGILVGAVYTVVSWRYIDWFIRHFLVSGSGGWFGFGLGRKVEKAVGTAGGAGHGTVTIAGVEMDLVFCELPMQLSALSFPKVLHTSCLNHRVWVVSYPAIGSCIAVTLVGVGPDSRLLRRFLQEEAHFTGRIP